MSLQWLEVVQKVHLPYYNTDLSLVLHHILILLSIFTFIIYKLIRSRSTKHLNLPPSPSKLPILGNLHQLGSSPHRALQALAQKYGPLMLLHFGQVPTLVVSSAFMAEQVMKTHDIVCSSRPNSSNITKRLLYGDKVIAFAPYGEYWRQMRKVVVLQFLSVKKVQAFKFAREEEIKAMVETIKNTKGVVNLSNMLLLFTNAVICRISLGNKYKYGGEGNQKRYNEMMKELGDLLGVFDVGSYIPWLSWVNEINSGLNARIKKNFTEMDVFLNQVIEDHIIRKKDLNQTDNFGGGEDQEEGEDLVDILLGVERDNSTGVPFARDNVKAIVKDMLSAGTDTTYGTIEWAIAELIRHPEVMTEVQKEVRGILKGKSEITEKDVQQMHYLQAVIKETFRLHPVVPLLVPRESTQDINIGGYDIPAKTTILINVFAIGRDPASWEDPDVYRPERFLNGGSDIDYRGINDFQLIPFGAGRRGCPGIQLGMATVELALATLLNEFCWEVPSTGSNNNEDLVDMSEGSGFMIIHRKSALHVIAKPYKS